MGHNLLVFAAKAMQVLVFAFLNARYQDPNRGLFLSEDPVFLAIPSQQN